MRIYSMTATFGKLEHQTLELEPGLNIIHAPNEWGKSTWCAFLVAMLYGIETQARTTKIALADKERYAPWSGQPMSGRMDLHWQGRDITIERKTKGRLIFGDFRAYETDTGIAIPELTAANCGAMLLGVEKSVFTRAGFIRSTDMTVTGDETLRRRLNDLVTTGDDSGTADRLAKSLRDLQNRCRYNRSGLLPQAESQRDGLKATLAQMDGLESQMGALEARQAALEQQQALLENHRAALAYKAAREDARKVEQARTQARQAREQLDSLEKACQTLPAAADLQGKLAALQGLQQAAGVCQEKLAQMPPVQAPGDPAFAGLSPQQAAQRAEKDAALYAKAKKQTYLPLAILAFLALIGGGVGLWLEMTVAAICGFGLGAVLLIAWALLLVQRRRRLAALLAGYTGGPEAWPNAAAAYGEVMARDAAREALNQQLAQLLAQQETLCGSEIPQSCSARWQEALGLWNRLEKARLDYRQVEQYAATLAAMVRTAPAPHQPDELTHSAPQTQALLAENQRTLGQLRLRLGQCQGQMQQLGDREALTAQLAATEARIAKLEDTAAALAIAQSALTEARAALQRRFAPRIAQRAQDLFASLTGGRYDRLRLQEDLSLLAQAAEEDTLRSPLWRSDGTVDQLYLALRLSVAEALTPEAPLILDDALVRFDDVRVKAALELLNQIGEKNQVLLFTCHGREEKLLATYTASQ